MEKSVFFSRPTAFQIQKSELESRREKKMSEMRSSKNSTPETANSKGGLPPVKLRRVIEYIEANLDCHLSLSELSAAIKMGAFHLRGNLSVRPECRRTAL